MLCIEEPNAATERFIFTLKAIIIRDMKTSNRIRKTVLSVLIAAISLSLYAEGVGFYREPHNGYVTEEGTPYSHDMNEASSSVYPIGTILEIGKDKIEVYVSDYFPGLPDRTILLNEFAAEKLGVLKTGWADLEVEISAPTDKKETETGWLSYKVGTYETNQEAYDAILLLEHNNFKATAKRSQAGCDVYINHITAYQAADFEAQLKELGFTDFSAESEHNPYL